MCTARGDGGKLPSGPPTLACGKGSGLGAVSADVHAAPAASAFFAGVEEVKNTGVALADTGVVFVREEPGGAVGDGAEEIGGVRGGEPEFGVGGFVETELYRVLRQEVIELRGKVARNGLGVFPDFNGMTQGFAESEEGVVSLVGEGLGMLQE